MRNFFFLVICFFFFISQSETAIAQSVSKAQNDFDQLNKAYYAGKLSEEKYLDSAYVLTNQYMYDGIHFKTQELTNLLSLFKEIAWSKKGHVGDRKGYYTLFLNNATTFQETGASMYYAEKVNEVYKNNGENDPLIEAATKSQIYMREELYNKVITQYVKKKKYLNSLPELLRKSQADLATGMQALTILTCGVIEAYSKTKDTVAVYQTAQLAYQIGNSIKHHPKRAQYIFFNDFFMLVTQYSVALFEDDQTKVGKILDSIAALKTTYKDKAKLFIDQNLFPWRIDHYLAIKNADSVRFYIKKFESLPILNKDQQAVISEYKAQLLSLQGDFQGSNRLLTSALAGERKAKTSLMTEMDNLLYAYTDAENTKIDLQQSEAIKKQRTLWLVIISCSAALIVLTVYLIMLYRSRKAKAQIAALNDAANMQVIAMEEAKHQAVREEQQRLGQDLHDGLASSIAGIRHRVETLSLNTDDDLLKGELNILQKDLTSAYKVARNKSHEWFSSADEQQEKSFEDRIKLLTDSALPDSRYHKTIQIDDNSLINIGTDTRITLLRIIQEAVTNIIKHAKARSIGILIYEEENSLILTISDDGVGLDQKKSSDKKTALGLDSIWRRVQYLNGEVNINSDSKGTEITISIPLML